MAVEILMEQANSLSGLDKIQRVITCMEFADAICLSDVVSSIFEALFSGGHHQLLASVEMGRSLRSRSNKISLCAQSVVAGIISNVQPGDHHLIALTADQLGKSDDVIWSYIKHREENLLLTNLTYITRRIFESSSGDSQDRDMADASSFILPTISNFDIQNTLPELQYDFCVLLDEIDREAPNDRVLTKICNDLHHLSQNVGRLPPGWEAQCIPQGLIYYVDHNTRSTTWRHPTISDGLPPGWAA
jgi:hypothetical protein